MDGAGSTVEAVAEVLPDLVTRHLRRVPEEADWYSVPLADLGLDSMVAIELVLDIEDTFGTQFPEELLVRETFATLRSLEAAVASMVAPS